MLYKNGTHPAHTLFQHWLLVLRSQFGDMLNVNSRMGWGNRGWAIGVVEMSEAGDIALGFGQYSSSGYFYPYFILVSDGRFRFNDMHGTYRRNQIAEFTFLEWGHTHGRYQWYVDTRPPQLRSYYGGNLLDWKNPLPYVSEDLIGCRAWHQTRNWLALDRDGDGWKIVPARNQAPVGNPGSRRIRRRAARQLQERWAHYDKIRERRYRKRENRWRIRNGLEPRTSARPVRVSNDGQLLTAQQAVEQLIALLDVTAPANSTPLPTPRPKEAPHGDNLVTTHAV